MSKPLFSIHYLTKFNQGRVVGILNKEGEIVNVGHVESFGVNSSDEVIVFVRTSTSSGKALPYHPIFLKVFPT